MRRDIASASGTLPATDVRGANAGVRAAWSSCGCPVTSGWRADACTRIDASVDVLWALAVAAATGATLTGALSNDAWAISDDEVSTGERCGVSDTLGAGADGFIAFIAAESAACGVLAASCTWSTAPAISVTRDAGTLSGSRLSARRIRGSRPIADVPCEMCRDAPEGLGRVTAIALATRSTMGVVACGEGSINSAPGPVSAGTGLPSGTAVEGGVAVETLSGLRATTLIVGRRLAAAGVPRTPVRALRCSRSPANGNGTRLEDAAACEPHRAKMSADSDPAPRVRVENPVEAGA